jgi:hypothetical protein
VLVFNDRDLQTIPDDEAALAASGYTEREVGG